MLHPLQLRLDLLTQLLRLLRDLLHLWVWWRARLLRRSQLRHLLDHLLLLLHALDQLHRLVVLHPPRRQLRLRHLDHRHRVELLGDDLDGDLTRSRAIRTISFCLSRIREVPYCASVCCAPSVSLGSVAPRMMSDRPMIW